MQTHLTTVEVAAICNCSEATVRRVCDELGDSIPRVGGRRMIPQEFVDFVHDECRRRCEAARARRYLRQSVSL